MLELSFAAEARADLKSSFVEATWEHPAAAKRLESEVRQRSRYLAEFPEFGRLRREFDIWLPGLRSTAIGKLVIYYRVAVEAGSVEILRVLDGRRDQALALLSLETESETEP